MSDKQKKDWGKIKKEAELQEEQSTPSVEKKEEQEVADTNASLEYPDYSDLEDQLTQAEQKAHENWEKAVRAVAELENVKRRAEKDIENAHRYGMEKLITSLLPVLDSLEQALQLAQKDENQSMCEGLELTMKLFLDTLNKSEVQQLNPEGALFDPQEHEAMSVQDSTELPENTVLAVFQKGYKLKDRIIRPARVIVSKKNKK